MPRPGGPVRTSSRTCRPDPVSLRMRAAAPSRRCGVSRMSITDSKEAPQAPAGVPATRFYRQVHVTALGLLIFVLLVYLLREFATILQQLLIAAFLMYLIIPA